MRTIKRTLVMLPAAVAGLLIAQVLRAGHRSDLPSYPNQDASGAFGATDLPALRIVALGDSSMTGPGVENIDNIWIRRIAIALSHLYRVELISLAVGGAKAKDVLGSQVAAAVSLAPDIAVLSVGANDAIRAVSPKRFRLEIKRIVSELDRASGAVVVLGVGDLGSIPRLGSMLRPSLTRRAAQFNAVAAAVAAEFPRAVKVSTAGPISTAFWEDSSLFAGDQFHASDAGHAIFADQALPAVRAAIAISLGSSGVSDK